MSIPTTPITVVLANRPRLFRELLLHALHTESSQFRVVEVADATPSPSQLHDADWLIVDEGSATEAAKLAATYPHLGILALERSGIRARVLAPKALANQQFLSAVPTLSQLFNLLTQNLPVERVKAAS
jgi:hypothetical protein